MHQSSFVSSFDAEVFHEEEVAYIEKHLPKTYDLTKDVADMIKEDKNQMSLNQGFICRKRRMGWC